MFDCKKDINTGHFAQGLKRGVQISLRISAKLLHAIKYFFFLQLLFSLKSESNLEL